MHVVETAILSTDLAMYFKKRTIFMELIENGEFDWQSEEKKEGKEGLSTIIFRLLVICKVGFPKFTPKQTNKHIILQKFYLKPKIFIIIFRFFFLKNAFHIELHYQKPDQTVKVQIHVQPLAKKTLFISIKFIFTIILSPSIPTKLSESNL